MAPPKSRCLPCFDARHQLRVTSVCSSTVRQNICSRVGSAVVFAMLASYGLSRTLTPITIGLLLKSERHGADHGTPAGFFSRASAAFGPRLRAPA